MNLLLKTWNGLAINDANPFTAYFPRGSKVNYSANAVRVNRAGNYPFLSGVVPNASTIMIGVQIAAGQSINTNRELLKQYFNFEDGTRHNLIAEDGPGGTQWYLTGFVTQPVNQGDEENSFFVNFAVEYPYWRLVTAGDTTWNITATGQTQAVTNAGNINVKPKITLTPTTTKTAGLKYRRWVSIENSMDVSFIAPLDITDLNDMDGGLPASNLTADASIYHLINEAGNINASVTTWNVDGAVGGGLPATGGMFVMDTEQCTYTLIAAGVISGVVRGVNGTTAATHTNNTEMWLSHLQADFSDVRVLNDGLFTDLWTEGTSIMQIWQNMSLAPRHTGTLRTTLANNSSDATVQFTVNRANLAMLTWLKSAQNTIFMIENEAFKYTASNINLVTYQITSVKRAQKTTSAAGHTAGVSIRHIEHDVWILMGDPALTAPDVDNDDKPMFDLFSTNGAWQWTYFYDQDSARPGAWKGEVLASRTGLSYVFTADSNTFADPATKMGLALIGSADFQVQNETGTLDWMFSHPAGITEVVFSGDKYMTGSWPAIVGLQYLQNNVAWFTADNQIEPTVDYTWESFGPTTATFSSPYPQTVRFVIDGLLSSAISEMALIQYDTVTGTWDAAKIPAITVGSEAACNFFDVTITNNTTGEYIKVAVPCSLNETVTIDCENKEAYLSDGSRVVVTKSTDRAEWLDLRPGANTLQYDDAGTMAVTAHVIHRDRSL